MSPEKKQPDETKIEETTEEAQPAWEGSLSDAGYMPAPDGHDVSKNALEGK